MNVYATECYIKRVTVYVKDPAHSEIEFEPAKGCMYERVTENGAAPWKFFVLFPADNQSHDNPIMQEKIKCVIDTQSSDGILRMVAIAKLNKAKVRIELAQENDKFNVVRIDV